MSRTSVRDDEEEALPGETLEQYEKRMTRLDARVKKELEDAKPSLKEEIEFDLTDYDPHMGSL